MRDLFESPELQTHGASTQINRLNWLRLNGTTQPIQNPFEERFNNKTEHTVDLGHDLDTTKKNELPAFFRILLTAIDSKPINKH